MRLFSKPVADGVWVVSPHCHETITGALRESIARHDGFWVLLKGRPVIFIEERHCPRLHVIQFSPLPHLSVAIPNATGLSHDEIIAAVIDSMYRGRWRLGLYWEQHGIDPTAGGEDPAAS